MPRRILLALGLLAPFAAQALEYRSVTVPVAILYDAPSAQAKKLYLVKQGMPVEVLVQVEGWTKVRDVEGSIAWLSRNSLDTRRTLVVTAASAQIRQTPQADAPVVFEAEKWVGLDYLETVPDGWVKVKHRDGVSGYVRVTQIWGL